MSGVCWEVCVDGIERAQFEGIEHAVSYALQQVRGCDALIAVHGHTPQLIAIDNRCFIPARPPVAGVEYSPMPG